MFCIDLTRDHISTEPDLAVGQSGDTGDTGATWNHNKLEQCVIMEVLGGW